MRAKVSLRLRCLLAFVGVLSAAGSANSQTANERTLAEALFRQARELMDQGDFDAACPKFAESQRLDPGGGTLLNLAVCHEKQGKFASAWAEFQEALAQARSEGRQARVSLAEERIAVLEPQLARVTIQVAEPKSDLTVTVNGTPLGAAGWGAAMPIDAGEVRVEAQSPKHEPYAKVVQIRDGEALTVEVPALRSSKPAKSAGSRAPEPQQAGTPPDNTVAYIAGGLGVMAIGAGTYFGVRAIQKHQAANEDCDKTCSTEEGSQNDKSGVFNGWLSTASFAVGIAALWIAVDQYTSEPSRPAEARLGWSPRIEPTGGGLDVTWHY